MFLRQSTAQVIKVGPFLDDTDGNTAETGLTLSNTDFRLSKDGGNFGSSSSGSATHDELGCYDKTLSTTDTNTVGELVVHVHESGALPVTHRYWVLEEAVYDLIFGASADMEVTVAALNSGVVTATSIAADAITSAKIADDAISSEHLADSVAVGLLYQGAIWLDVNNGSSGTTIGTNGTPGNPSDSLANAKALADSTGLRKIYFLSDSTQLFTSIGEDLDDITFENRAGPTPVLILAGTHDVDSCVFRRVNFSGTNNNGVGSIRLEDGVVGSIGGFTSLELIRCSVGGTLAPNGLGAAELVDCYTAGSSGAAITLDMTANNGRAALRRFAGNITVENMDSTNTILVDGQASITIDSSCTGGTILIRGQVDYTDNSGGAVTVTELTGVNVTQINGESSRVDTWGRMLDATIDTTITSGGGSTTSFVASGIPTSNDDQLIDRVGIFIDGDAAGRAFVITDYTNSSKTVTMDALNVAPSNGDRFLIFA